jgi:hypothetical protein
MTSTDLRVGERTYTPKMLRLRKQNLAKWATLAVVAGGLTVATTQAAWADFVINVNPGSGSDTTNFSITLPSGAKCSGDTAAGGYHVYSYVVPSSVDPRTLNFSTGSASQGVSLIDSTGTPYNGVLTGVATGSIQALPNPFNWSPYINDYGPGFDLFAGNWNVGIACANSAGQIDIPGATGNNGGFNYWNYAQDLSDGPTTGTFNYSVNPASLTPEAPLAIGLPLSALALGGAAAYVLRRRRRHAAATGA